LKEKDLASEVPEGKKAVAMPVIVVAKKSIFQAAKDWEDVKRDRAIFVKEDRAAAFRNCKFGGPQRNELWKGLIAVFKEIPEETAHEAIVATVEKIAESGIAIGKKRRFDDLDDF
jgi:hypothetical protein